MHRIVVENFGPVRRADISIKPLLVLIGQQASGKSTIARLIYFFKTIGDTFFSKYYSSPTDDINDTNDIISPIREKFYDFFGFTAHLPDFKIVYYYSHKSQITLTLDEDRHLLVTLSKQFFPLAARKAVNGYKNALIKLKNEIEQGENISSKILLENKQVAYLHMLSDKIDEIFLNEQNDSLYIVAGRNATVGYGESFDELLMSSIRQKLNDQGRRAFQVKEQTINETVMLEFMRRVKKNRQSLSNLGDFKGIISGASESKRQILTCAYSLIKNILKGDYSHDSSGEKIIHENGQYVYLDDASSGQQEAIRILQDLFIAIYSDNKVFRVIEEPEAHLFPDAQMNLVYLFSLLLNDKPQNQLLITTHSPYILTIINNLMFAQVVGSQKRDAVNEIISDKFWQKPENVACYILQNGESEDIIDYEMSMIKAEKIDGVSTILRVQFDQIMNLPEDEKTE